jgi:peptidoglycan/xylan/chitin deacetylase (PgdA/CDA1 family)
VISVDAELGWGFHDIDPPTSRVEAARTGWKRLAGLFNEYDVPATWAVVGRQCDEQHWAER